MTKPPRPPAARTAAKPATRARPARAAAGIDLATTRDLLEQMHLAHQLVGSPALTPTVRSRVAATLDHLGSQLPAAAGAGPGPEAPPATELSGPAWVARFPGRNDPDACIEPFRSALTAFLAALAAAGATVRIAATLRPPERAYLMHWSWKIAKNIALPQEAGPMNGVAIDWVHRDATGQPDLPKSRSAAMQMVAAYGIVAQPALQSRHTEGRAVDMDVGWNGDLGIKDKGGTLQRIVGAPRDGTHPDLRPVGASYGVIKAVFAGDPPHWSEDGH